MKSRKTILYIVFALILSLGITACQAEARSIIEAPALIDIQVTGVEGLGEAEPELLHQGKQDVLGLTDEEYEAYRLDPDLIRSQKGSRFSQREALLDSLEVNISPQSGLSNGDIMTVNVEADQAAWSELGIELKVFPWDVRVKGLTALRAISLTEGLTLTAEGYNGSGVVAVSNPTLPESVRGSVIYRMDRTKGLSNGEIVRVSVSVNEEALAQQGLRPLGVQPADLRVEGLTELQPLDLAAHTELQYEGFDGEGTAHLLSRGIPQDIIDQIEYRVTPERGLSNGDSVRVTAIYDADRLRAEGYTVTAAEMVRDVQGLSEWQVINPFDGVRIVTEGRSEAGRARLVSFQLPATLDGLVSFALSPATGLKNGDSVTVRADADLEELRARGIRLAELEQSFTVTGLQEFPTDLSGYDLDSFLTRLDPLIYGMIDQRIVVPNRWQPNRTQSTWDTEVSRTLESMHYVWEQNNPEDNYAALVYRVQISGRISSYRRGVRESYSRNGRANKTLFLTVHVPSLEFIEGQITAFEAPVFRSIDNTLSEARLDAIGTANLNRTHVMRVPLRDPE